MKKQETNNTFTQEEIVFVRNVFSQQTVNPMSPNAVEIIERVQGIVKKMEANKEEKTSE